MGIIITQAWWATVEGMVLSALHEHCPTWCYPHFPDEKPEAQGPVSNAQGQTGQLQQGPDSNPGSLAPGLQSSPTEEDLSALSGKAGLKPTWPPSPHHHVQWTRICVKVSFKSIVRKLRRVPTCPGNLSGRL